MKVIDNGGPAFPFVCQDHSEYQMVNQGMTLRDWFAGMAMSGMLRFSPRDLKTYDDLNKWAHGICVASVAYGLADAMIERRNETDMVNHEARTVG